ncbi:helix-turn-helix domain-containing protein [Spirillospora sp. CA-253888]
MWAWIAHDLRWYRAQRGLSGTALARLLSVGRSSVSRLENGQVRLSEKQAETLDHLWKTGGHFARLIFYASRGHDPDWFRQHLHLEAKATLIKTWELAWIPGLLQTPEYARAGLIAGGFRDIDAHIEARLIRQAIFEREEPPVMWALIWEAALRTPIGSAATMRGQCGRLLEMEERPNIAIRIVPMAAGAHLGLDGSFKLLTSGGAEVAYVEAPGGGRLVPSSAEVLEYAIRWDRIGHEALPSTASRGFIEACMKEWE